MSWLKFAVSKAVEVGNKNDITRAVKNYANTVVQHAGQAVAEGAKLLQDRIVAQNFQSAKYTIKRLEEAAVSCKVAERAHLLRRWLVVLKEIEKSSDASSKGKGKTLEEHIGYDESKHKLDKPSWVLYVDDDAEGEPMNFRDVFLQSQALEGITLSMILESPNDEEVALLLEMFRLCLTGDKEIHNAIASSIQDLANAFSGYEDEVLVKREELLQFAQNAITGLKINADLGRIDAEAGNLKKKLDTMTASQEASNEDFDKLSKESTKTTIESLKRALSQIRACSRLEEMLRKKFINNGDSPEIHVQKVDKLKVLSQSLANSTSKAEKRISDYRVQKEEALKVRVTKASEAGEKEKELSTEISVLEKRRDDLEAELKKVNISLAAAQARLRYTKEERDHFEEANTQIIAHLKTEEDELLKSISSCRVEEDVLSTWINFLEDTWALQCSYTETKEKQVKDELEKHEDYFVNLAVRLLSAYKKELGPAIGRIGIYVENINNLGEGSRVSSSVDTEELKVLHPRKNLEEEYLDYEAKIVTTLSVVDHVKEKFYVHRGQLSRKDDSRVKELFDDIEKLRGEFDSIERPTLEIETPTSKADTPTSEKSQTSSFHFSPQDTKSVESKTDKHPVSGTAKAEQDTKSVESKIDEHPISGTAKAEQDTKSVESKIDKHIVSGTAKAEQDTKSLEFKIVKHPVSGTAKAEPVLDAEAELAKLESEFGKVGQDYYTEEEIGGWEFDELERELGYGDSASN